MLGFWPYLISTMKFHLQLIIFKGEFRRVSARLG